MEIPTTFVAKPKQANSTTTIDGYTFVGFTYANAIELWYSLYQAPGYVSRPPKNSVSVDIEVSGDVR